jgi:hypothetical protein
MRLSDARLRRHQSKLIYPDHRLPPWFTEDDTPRSLEPIVRRLPQLVLLRILRTKLNPEIKAAAIAAYISPFNSGVNK